jgi:hypothetical protein
VWPWEHLAVGYLVYSVATRALSSHRLTATTVAALAFGTQFPDLVDKPLGWGTTLLPSGLSLAHSVLFAVPFSALVVTVGTAFGRTGVAAAFALGYLTHLPGDVIYPLLVTGDLSLGFLLWPLVPADPSTVAVLPFVEELAVRFLRFLRTPRGLLYLILELGLLGAASARWYTDGLPGLRWAIGWSRTDR